MAFISRLNRHKTFIFLLTIFSLVTIYNSMRLPLGEAADETDHYRYLRFVARTGHPPFTAAERTEAGFKGGLAPLYYWLTAWPIALVGQDSVPDIRRVDSRPERFLPTDGLGINRVLHTLDEQWPWRGQVLAWHLVRLFSLPMAWVTIIATYALARRLFPQQKIIALGAATFIVFLPRFVISSAVINDDNLVFALTALLLLIQVSILQGDDRPRTFAIFGVLFGLALVTKYFSLILFPEITFTLLLFLWRKVAGSRISIKNTYYALRTTPYAAFLIGLTLTAGPWFTFITLRFNRVTEIGLIPGLAAALGEPQITDGLVGLLAGQAVRPPAATYPFSEWFSLLYRSFWFEYGWMKIFAPTWIYSLFTTFLALILFGLVQKIPVYLKDLRTEKNLNKKYARRSTPDALYLLLTLHLALFLVVVLSRYVLSATIDTGQGRHLYPALPVVALLVGVGAWRLWSAVRTLTSGKWPAWIGLTAISLPAFVTFLLPAMLSLAPNRYILPYYQTLPITIRPPTELSLTHHHTIAVTEAISFAGFDVRQPATAGDTLPVTLYWVAEQQVNQDYLVSLCLQDDQQRPVACGRSHFVNGRYPARAWEPGDTVIDTMFIPIPICYRLSKKAYRLSLDLWPLQSASLSPRAEAQPALQKTFAEPIIMIQATDSLSTNLSQTVELWRTDQRLTGPTHLALNETLTQITYDLQQSTSVGAGITATSINQTWLPLPQFDTPLYLPCDDGLTPFAHSNTFIADASLPPAVYQTDTSPPLTLTNRLRAFVPLTATLSFKNTLSFSDTLSPLSLSIPQAPIVDLQPPLSPLPSPLTNLQLPTSHLSITIRWQTRRWMADPLAISLKLLDKDFVVGGERIATLGERYPNVLWAPTELIEETYPLAVRPDAAPGLYRLELSLIRQDETLPEGFEYLSVVQDDKILDKNLNPITIRLLDPAHGTTPGYPISAQMGASIRLTGYDIVPQPSISASQPPTTLTLHWQSTAKIPIAYTVFTQLIGPDGQVWAQWDNPPQAGRYPTTAWDRTDAVIDRYTLSLREGAPAGDYRLLIGMYDPNSGERLPIKLNGQQQPHNALELTTIFIAP